MSDDVCSICLNNFNNKFSTQCRLLFVKNVSIIGFQ